MILLEVDLAGIAALEFEGQAPGAVDVNGVAPGLEAFQRVEIKARQVYLPGTPAASRRIELGAGFAAGA